ncbi:HSCB C-terminal oligomerization domain-containing protein, partial [Chytriomyces sp. MP71]
FDVDLGALKQRFLALQQIVHPDANSQRSQREFSEKQSVFINKAYQTLRDPLSRAKYMLHLNGIHIDESVKGGMDPSSLMKIMDIWEAIEEVEDQAGLDILMKENEERISTEVQASSKAFEASDLEAARKAVTKLQYWYSLRQRLRD